MFETKATITGCIGAVALVIALFSPAREVTSADSLVGFASGEHVTIHTEQCQQRAVGTAAAGQYRIGSLDADGE